MSTTAVEKGNIYIHEQYWKRMSQYKFDLIYYGFYFEKCVSIMRILNIISIGLTTLSTACFMKWSTNKTLVFICGIIIIVSQVYNAIIPLIPYEKRKTELRDMTNELEIIYTNMEQTWRIIANNQLTNTEDIDFNLKKYISEWEDKKRHYFKDDSLPENKKNFEKAKEETDKYLGNLI